VIARSGWKRNFAATAKHFSKLFAIDARRKWRDEPGLVQDGTEAVPHEQQHIYAS
jgi:hypothetical protein